MKHLFWRGPEWNSAAGAQHLWRLKKTQALQELTWSVLRRWSSFEIRRGCPTRRLEVLNAPRRTYRLPPLPPTSAAPDDSMIGCLSALRVDLLPLKDETQTWHPGRLGFLDARFQIVSQISYVFYNSMDLGDFYSFIIDVHRRS